MTARSLLARVWFPVFCVVLFCLLLWLGLANRSLYFELKGQGKEPVSVGPIATPNDGNDGKSAYELWLEDGNQGSRTDFLLSLVGRDGQDGQPGLDGIAGASVQGKPGKDGADGQDGLSIQGERGEPGAQGLQGVPGVPGAVGATGSAGADGRTPVLGCVIRTINNLPVSYIAWKYTNEADSAYRNLYRVPNWAQAEGCISQTEVAV